VAEELHDDAAAIWTACLESLDGAGSTHKAWLAQTRPVTIAGDTFVLAVPDEFVKEWVEQRYVPTVADAAARVAGRRLDVRVTVRPLDLASFASVRAFADRFRAESDRLDVLILNAGGVLAHARGMTAVCAPTVNAYKRFVAQELGPYFVDWGTDNRSVCVRIPAERGKGTRLESRLSDGSASAYLASAVHIFAGVDGVERQLDPAPPTEHVYEPPVERATVPFSLGEALDALEADEFTRSALGEQFMQAFTTIKRNEWRRFQLAVTDWELREYADAL